MSALERRLAKLEQLQPKGAQRCATCWEWPLQRVVYEDDWVPVHRRPEGNRLTCPEQCPSCGWKPLTIVVEYVEMTFQRLRAEDDAAAEA